MGHLAPLLFVFFGVLWPAFVSSENGTACGSLEINRLADFRKLQNCTYVVGHVRIAYVDVPDGNFSLESLSTNVTEISDFLMVYRCSGLLTLESIFPRLRIIRGQALLFDEYSLVVYENRNLRELGLVELLRVQRGFIRIESNPMLCFVETVDWMHMLGNGTRQHFSIKHNKPPSHCPLCGGLSADYSFNQNSSEFCWNLNTSQLRPQPPRLKDCPQACGINGCNNAGKCCDRNCVTECSGQNCSLCANYQGRFGCVNQCLASYELNKRQCITSTQCRDMGRIPLAGGYSCAAKCPGNQKKIMGEKGMFECQVNCTGDFHVKGAADLEVLRDCDTINGSLTIELANIKGESRMGFICMLIFIDSSCISEKIVDALDMALVNVKEITGYLKVIHSAQLTSLTFLQHLDSIRGNSLVENKYALYVVNNHHLEHIWPPNHLVMVQRGSIFFHLNPRLCYDKIIQLAPSLKSVQEISVADVSPNSNGERVICGSSVRSLNLTVEDLNSTAVRIVLDYMDWEGMETLIGYSYYYKEAPQQNVTMYDGRHGCGHDNWLMKVSLSRIRRYVIAGLKPYTQYAFFVKTLTRTDYHMQMDAYSKISYFQTLADRPSPVVRIHGSSELSTQILLHWWPPLSPNGVISKYLVTYEKHNATKEEKAKNYFNSFPSNMSDLDCQCNDAQPYDSGPQPDDEDYYNKEQITYEDALPNLIYVSRRQEYRRKKEFDKVIDYADLKAYKIKEGPTMPPTTTPAPTNETLEKEIQAARNYEKFRLQSEQKLRSYQDLGEENFKIRHAMSKCQDSHASVSQQVEDKCVIEEALNGIELPGNQHYYYISQLEPETFYRVTVRACVDGVVNGCSTPTEAVVKTTSLRIEQFIKGV
ncbi:hypothetical protein KR009_005630 [Drosophila setifemur]|nr:hypothetical protein KR009_005630 [Drosophila setifemur]